MIFRGASGSNYQEYLTEIGLRRHEQKEHLLSPTVRTNLRDRSFSKDVADAFVFELLSVPKEGTKDFSEKLTKFRTEEVGNLYLAAALHCERLEIS
jgi:hypothetical protein